MRLIVALALFVCWAPSGFALNASDPSGRVEQYFSILKDIPVDLSADSAIEEELARLDLYKFYRPHLFIIDKNVQIEGEERTLGELDIVIRDRATGRVVLVAEVKRGIHPKPSSRNAASQLRKFEEALRDGTVKLILQKETGDSIAIEAFDLSWEKRIIGVRVKADEHYPYELDITSEELKDLKSRVRKHQAWVYQTESERKIRFRDFWVRKARSYQDILPALLQRFDCAWGFL